MFFDTDVSQMNLEASFFFVNDLNGNPLFLQKPVERLVANQFSEIREVLLRIDQRVKEKKFFLAGYISYEAAYAIMDVPYSTNGLSQLPFVDFYVFAQSALAPAFAETPTAFYKFHTEQTDLLYKDRLDKIFQQLVLGNSYQVNYTFQNKCSSYGPTQSLFSNLYKNQKSFYAACIQLEEQDILSLSPELFFAKQKNKIITKPMKGTLPPNSVSIDDLTDEHKKKLQAENWMIVDLLRNDLSRVAKPESVKVTRLMEVEKYKTVQQFVSTIEGELEEDTLFSDIIYALFPCGSITGAPKRKTMELIRDLESTPRGLYTGAIGFMTPEQDMQFSVAIRTLVGREQWSYGVGGGIVVGSKTEDEFEEAKLKAQFIFAANQFFLFETLLFDGKIIVDQNAHLLRLQKSATFFNFHYSNEKAISVLQNGVKNLTTVSRVRLQLERGGDFNIHASSLEIPLSSALLEKKRITWSQKRTNSKDLFLRHKTSERELYDTEYAKSAQKGFYDVLFLNEKGHVSEASRHNVFIRKGEQWLTPPLSSGLLPGVEREKSIDFWSAQEKILTLDDILSADEVWLTNSVRGKVPVEVVP